MVVSEGGGGLGHFLGLLEDYIANLSLFRSLEPFKKFVEEGGAVGGGGGGWSRVILVLSLSFKLNNISIIQ